VSACWGQGLAVQWQVAVSDGTTGSQWSATLAHFCSSYTGNVFLINCVCRCWNQHL